MPRTLTALPLSLLLAVAGCATATDADSTGLDLAEVDAFYTAEAQDPAELAATALELLASNDKLLDGIEAYDVLTTRVDTSGTTHLKVQQTLGGVPVLGAEAVVHVLPNGLLHTWTDAFAHGLTADTTGALSETEAIELAWDDGGGERGFDWLML
jgi:Zn-dependent metalloprotease